MNTEDRDAQTPTIVVDGLCKRYGDVEALRGIDFSVGAGEIVGFLGPNGAGKTTAMKILTGFMAPTSGRAVVGGFDVEEQSSQVRQIIGYLPENVPLYRQMLVHDYLQFVAQLQGVASSGRQERILTVAQQTGLMAMLGKQIGELSKGYRQRVGLAQAIIHEPQVIILDEPTTGLDPNQIVEFRDVIKTVGQEKTILFCTHILQEVSAVCDRIIIIAEGKLRADGTPDQLREQAGLARGQDSLEALFRYFTLSRPIEAIEAGEAVEATEVEASVDAADNGPDQAAVAVEEAPDE